MRTQGTWNQNQKNYRNHIRSSSYDFSKITSPTQSLQKIDSYFLPFKQIPNYYLETKNIWNNNYFRNQIEKLIHDHTQYTNKKNNQIDQLKNQKQQLLNFQKDICLKCQQQLILNKKLLSQKKQENQNLNKSKINQELQIEQKQNQKIKKQIQMKYKMEIQMLKRKNNQFQQHQQLTHNHTELKLNKIYHLQCQLNRKNNQLSQMQLQIMEIKNEMKLKIQTLNMKLQQSQERMKIEKIKLIQQKQKLYDSLNRSKHSYQSQLKILKSRYQNQLARKVKLYQNNQQIFQTHASSLKYQLDRVCSQFRKCIGEKNHYFSQLEHYKIQNQQLKNKIMNIQIYFNQHSKKIEEEYNIKLRQNALQHNRIYQNLKKQFQQKLKNQSQLRKSMVLQVEKDLTYSYEKEVNQLKNKMNEITEQQHDKKILIQNLNNQTEQIQKNKTIYQAHIQELQNSNQALNESILVLKKTNNQQIDYLKQTIKIMEKNVQELQEKIMILDKEHQVKFKEQLNKNKILQNKLIAQHSKQLSLNQKVAQNHIKISQYQSRLAQKDIKIQLLIQQNNRLQIQILNYKNQLERKSQQYRKALESFNCEGLFDNLKIEYQERLQRKQIQHNRHSQQLKNNLETMQKQKQVYKYKLQTQMKQYQELIKKLKEEINNKNEKLIILEGQRNNIQRINNDLKQNCKQFKVSINKIKQQNNQILTQYQRYQQKAKNDLQFVSTQLKQKEQSIANHEILLLSLNKKISNYEKTIQIEQASFKKLEKQLQEIKLEYKNQQSIRKQNSKKNKSLYQVQVRKLQDQVQALRVSLQTNQERIDTMQREHKIQINKNKHRISELQDQIVECQKQYKRKMQIKDQSYKKYTEIYEENKRKLNESCEKILELDSNLVQKNKQIITLKNQILLLQTKLETENDLIREQMDCILKTEIEKRQNQILNLTKKIDRLQNEKFNLQISHKNKCNEFRTQKKNIMTELTKKSFDQCSAIVKLEKINQEMRLKFDQLKRKYIIMNQRFQNVQESFRNCNKQLETDILDIGQLTKNINNQSIYQYEISFVNYPEISATKSINKIQENDFITNQEGNLENQVSENKNIEGKICKQITQ